MKNQYIFIALILFVMSCGFFDKKSKPRPVYTKESLVEKIKQHWKKIDGCLCYYVTDDKLIFDIRMNKDFFIGMNEKEIINIFGEPFPEKPKPATFNSSRKYELIYLLGGSVGQKECCDLIDLVFPKVPIQHKLQVYFDHNDKCSDFYENGILEEDHF